MEGAYSINSTNGQNMTQTSQGYAQSDSAITQLKLIVIIFEVLSLVALALRFVARRIAHNSLGWDDWLAFVAGILSVINMANDLVIIRFGVGRPMASIPKEDAGKFLLFIFVGQSLYAPIIVVVKMAVLTLYLRLFKVNQTLKRTVYVLMGLTCAWGVSAFITVIVQCTPVQAAWMRSPSARCINIGAFLWGTNVPDVLLDVVILLTPAPIIWGLQIPRSKKIAILGIFLLAAFDTAMAVVRLASLTNFNYHDLALGFANPLIWSTIEINVGIVCACLPVMAPIFTRLFGPCLGSWSSRGGSTPIKTPEPPNPSYHVSKMGNRISVMSMHPPNRFRRLDDVESGSIEMTTAVTITHEKAAIMRD